jgi:polar amino acid transport system substrate-binding protein
LTIRLLIAAILAVLDLILFSFCPSALAQPVQGGIAGRGDLNVATKQAPPFAMKASDGNWTGLAIDLMNEVARDLGKKITWTEVKTTQDLLKIATEGRVDAAIAAITVTSDREKIVDFSQGYYESGLAIAVHRKHGAGFWAGLQAVTSPAFLGTVGVLVVLLLTTGALVWLIENRQNAEQFEKHPIKGIGSGFWWAAVTMTTVGYGDKAPVTPFGRFVAVIWMFAALILTAAFTAHLTTALTLDRLSGPVTSLGDLPRSRFGIVDRTASSAYFDARSIATISFPSVASGLEALEAGRIDAFVHDEPILRYEVRRNHLGKLELLPEVFEPQVYGIAFPSGSMLREPLNQALLAVLASPRWMDIKARYFGRAKNAF